MPNAQDQAFARLAESRRLIGPDVLSRVPPGKPLPQALLDGRVLAPKVVAGLLRDLARTQFCCPACTTQFPYDKLASLPQLRCPTCAQGLQLSAAGSPQAPPSRGIHNTLASGAFAAATAPPHPSGAFGVPSSGAFVAPPAPSRFARHPSSGTMPVPTSGQFAAPISEGTGTVNLHQDRTDATVRGHPAQPPVHREFVEATPKSIGSYVILEELGRGSNGIVFLAQRKGLARKVALKVLKDHGMLDQESIVRFQREAKVMSKLDDPGIISVHDIGKDGRFHYLAMDYCPGPTLADRLHRGPFPPREAAELVMRLAKSVHVAHERGVIHRDLKPANIILEQSTGRARITDFGLARDATDVHALTHSGDVLGTPYYMSPEQFRGERRIDARIDVYALGVLFYECLTGLRPFEAPTAVLLVDLVLAGKVKRPRKISSKIPKALERICLKAMATDKDRRHASAAELAAELEHALSEDDAKPAGNGGGGRPPIALLAGVLAPLLVVGIVGVMVVTASNDPGNAPGPDTPLPTPGVPDPVDQARAERLLQQQLDAEAVLDRSRQLLEQGQVRRARVELERARGLAREVESLAPRIAAEARLIGAHEALAEAAELLATEQLPDYDVLRAVLERALDQAGTSEPVRARVRLELVRLATGRGRFEQALSDAADLIDQEDELGFEARYHTTTALYRLRRDEEATRALEWLAGYPERTAYP